MTYIDPIDMLPLFIIAPRKLFRVSITWGYGSYVFSFELKGIISLGNVMRRCSKIYL